MAWLWRMSGRACVGVFMLAAACSSGGGGGGMFDGGAGSGATSGFGGTAGVGAAGSGGFAGAFGGASGVGGASGAGAVGGLAGSGGGPGCKLGGTPCQAFNECCSGVCAAQVCTSCGPPGNGCGSSSDCCVGLQCNAGKCSACVGEGASCMLSSDCCSTICDLGTCAPCRAIGESCTGSTECCSGQCSGGMCGGGTPGACTNPADESVKSSYTLATEAYNCVPSCFNQPGCVADCMSTKTGLSAGCASCYDEAVQCMVKNCLSPCGGGIETAQCKSCQAQFCAGPFTQCSGWAQP